jgi:hypothetical protein
MVIDPPRLEESEQFCVGDPMTKQQCMYDIAQLQPTKDLNTGDM